MIDKVTSSPSTILNWIVSTLEAASGTAMLNGVVIDYCRLRRNPLHVAWTAFQGNVGLALPRRPSLPLPNKQYNVQNYSV
jgi:hypothetical protein